MKTEEGKTVHIPNSVKICVLECHLSEIPKKVEEAIDNLLGLHNEMLLEVTTKVRTERMKGKYDLLDY